MGDILSWSIQQWTGVTKLVQKYYTVLKTESDGLKLNLIFIVADIEMWVTTTDKDNKAEAGCHLRDRRTERE